MRRLRLNPFFWRLAESLSRALADLDARARAPLVSKQFFAYQPVRAAARREERSLR